MSNAHMLQFMLLVSFVVANLDSTDSKQAHLLLERCIQKANQLDNYVAEFTGKTTFNGKDTEKNKVTIWVRGKKSRMDMVKNKNEGCKECRTVLCTNCILADHLTVYNISDTGMSPLRNLKQSDVQYQMYAQTIPDLKRMWYTNFDYCAIVDKDDSLVEYCIRSLDSFNCTYTSISDILHKIVLTAKDGSKRTISFTINSHDDHITNISDVSPNHIQNASFEYDKSTGYVNRLTYQNGRPTAPEITQYYVVVRDLKKEDDIAFTLEGFGLRNTSFLYLKPGVEPQDQPTWMDGKVSDLTVRDQILASDHVKNSSLTTTADTPKPSLISQAWPYFLGFVVFAVLGFWLIRKQRQAAKEG